MPPAIALSAGEPAGVGPELCLAVAAHDWPARLASYGSLDQRTELARRLYPALRVRGVAAPEAHRAGELQVVDVPLEVPAQPGRLERRNARAVLHALDAAAHACRSAEVTALVTAPVHKAVINDAGIPFTGHTEYLAALTGGTPVMMLVAGGLRVALATTHLALAAVPAAITPQRLEAAIRILCADLVRRFGIDAPRVLVAGLNPHAGEGGHLGDEEIRIIAPVLEALRVEGFDLQGPLPADTLFTPARLAGADAVLAMYHDQGLPVLKYAGFGTAVNVTLGLPIIRTSVDHGTALDLAGTGRADAGSLEAAIELAIALAQRAAA